MTSIDVFTITIATALVVLVSGVLYLVETLLRKEGGAGRLWATAYLAGILSVLCYLVWSIEASAYIAVALGNGAFVATTGLLWLGCRAYNRRDVRGAGVGLAVGITVVVAAVLAEGVEGGAWAGAVAMFLGNAVFAALGAVETRRGALAAQWSGIGLTIVLSAETVWFVVRTGVFLVAGPDSELFRTWFDTPVASLLTMALTITAVVTTSVLRAGESSLRGHRETVNLHMALDGVLLPGSFRALASRLLRSALHNHETACVIALRMDDLSRIGTAFGPGEAEAVAAAWRTGVRRYAPSAAIVGEGDRRTVLAAFLTTSFADVRRTAAVIHQRTLDDMSELGLSVIPAIAVGVALSDQIGHDFDALVEAAREAARRSASSTDAAVILAEG
ncbi:hypothetical protein F6B41_23250 [Microbacterium lushaniae]|nr:hypothetical protein F6B41_23250 [Microbacterium lushaniae]